MTKNELLELKEWILEWMTIASDNEGNISLHHSCEHYTNPEKGHCRDCEMFVKMNKMFDDMENDLELVEIALSQVYKPSKSA